MRTNRDEPFKRSRVVIIIAPMVAEDVQYCFSISNRVPPANGPLRATRLHPECRASPPSTWPSRTHEKVRGQPKTPDAASATFSSRVLDPSSIMSSIFEHVHPCFPIVDEEAFCSRPSRIPCSLYCQIYAIYLTFWNRSKILKHHPCLNSQYFWVSAIAALQEDFLAPHLATLYPALIDLSGRPLGAIQGNVVNSVRTVALARSMELNGNPHICRVSPSNIRQRIHLFWAMLHFGTELETRKTSLRG
ncbi:hypothetical protein IWX50DRAFT_240817 [Phyllosticta citricarpa]